MKTLLLKYSRSGQQLQEKKIKSHIIFPVKLKLFEKNRKIKVFDYPQAAVEGLCEYDLNMELPAMKPDLESSLHTAGWPMAHSGSRRRPACELMSGVKILLDSVYQHERAMDRKSMCGLLKQSPMSRESDSLQSTQIYFELNK